MRQETHQDPKTERAYEARKEWENERHGEDCDCEDCEGKNNVDYEHELADEKNDYEREHR
jgi:hypothetical protein